MSRIQSKKKDSNLEIQFCGRSFTLYSHQIESVAFTSDTHQEKLLFPRCTKVIASRRISVANRSKDTRFPVYVRFPYTPNVPRLLEQSLEVDSSKGIREHRREYATRLGNSMQGTAEHASCKRRWISHSGNKRALPGRAYPGSASNPG